MPSWSSVGTVLDETKVIGGLFRPQDPCGGREDKGRFRCWHRLASKSTVAREVSGDAGCRRACVVAGVGKVSGGDDTG